MWVFSLEILFSFRHYIPSNCWKKIFCMQFINNFLQKKRKHFYLNNNNKRFLLNIYTIIWKVFFLKCNWIVWGNPIKWRHFLRAFCGILSNQQPRNYRPHAISLENQISLLSARIFVFLLAAHCTKIRKKCYLVGKYKINFFIDISSIGAPAKCKRVKRGKNKKVDFSHWGR